MSFSMFPYYSNYMTALLFGNPKAYAYVRGIPDYDTIQGMVLFYDTGNGSIVTADFKGLPTEDSVCGGEIFGFHIHEGERCSGTKEDPLADTGLHLNPDRCEHPHHMGDMPPLFENRGKAWCAFYTERFRIWDIIGKTVVLHRGSDDFKSQPSGDSGMKIGCGIIRRELQQ